MDAATLIRALVEDDHIPEDDEDMSTKDFVMQHGLALRNELTGGDWKSKALFELGQHNGDEDTTYDPDKEGISSEEKCYAVSDGNEYTIYKDDDTLEQEAMDRVTSDLQESPEIFNQSYFVDHVDSDKLRRELQSDVESMVSDTYSDDDEWVDALIENGDLERSDFFDEYDDRMPVSDEATSKFELAKERWVEKRVEDTLADPVAYLSEFYSQAELPKKLIEMGVIDIYSFAKFCIRTDGAVHFLNSYDEEEIDLPCGAVAIRTQ